MKFHCLVGIIRKFVLYPDETYRNLMVRLTIEKYKREKRSRVYQKDKKYF